MKSFLYCRQTVTSHNHMLGTGCAPFRSFIAERTNQGVKSKKPLHYNFIVHFLVADSLDNFLFFGCRSKDKDFFFADEWLPMVKSQSLQLYAAFSRDQVKHTE